MDELLRLLDAAYPEARCELEHEDPFQLVVATILSAQCTDARVNLTTPALFAKYPDSRSLAKADLEDLETIIRSTGFYHNKAKNLVGMAKALVERHDGQVPRVKAELAALPGVGPKTANVVLANAFGVPALAVDTHIFRVARRLGLSKASTPEKVEEDLCASFPETLWIPLHHQLIWHGRRVCDARKPRCTECTLRELCPTGTGRIPDPHTGNRLETGDRRLEVRGERLSSGPNGIYTSLQPRPTEPQRIVSLVPSVTELLAQWGLEKRIVGRTRYCVEPSSLAKRVPDLGGTKDPDVKQIIQLKPDLVILEQDENTKAAAETMKHAGLALLVLEIRSLKDCVTAWRRLGKRLGVEEKGNARAEALEAKLRLSKSTGPRTLVLIWKKPWMSAGKGSYVADLVNHAGFKTIGSLHYSTLLENELTRLNPELILLPTDPYSFTQRDRTELRKHCPNAGIHILDGKALTWFLSRTEQGLELLRKLRKSLEA